VVVVALLLAETMFGGLVEVPKLPGMVVGVDLTETLD
jgi:hypothetical protein